MYFRGFFHPGFYSLFFIPQFSIKFNFDRVRRCAKKGGVVEKMNSIVDILWKIVYNFHMDFKKFANVRNGYVKPWININASKLTKIFPDFTLLSTTNGTLFLSSNEILKLCLFDRISSFSTTKEWCFNFIFNMYIIYINICLLQLNWLD